MDRSNLDQTEPLGQDVQVRDAVSAGDQVGLTSPSFLGLLGMQFLTATNDNIFRWLVVGIGKQYVEESNVRYVLTAGMISFVLPYLLLAAPSGYLADRFSKRSVIVACKFAEIVLMGLALLAIWAGSFYGIFVVLALMGAQSCLFSPARMGAIPEMLRADCISAANGCMGLATVLATVVGAAVGNVLSDYTEPLGQNRLWLSAVILIGIAIIGWGLSLLLLRFPAADRSRRFPWNPVPQVLADFRTLSVDRALLRVALGSMFFWSLGSLANMNIDQYVFENRAAGGEASQSQVAPLLACLAVGVGLGSLLAGVWSAGRVELGLLPLGGAILSLGSVLLFFVDGDLIRPDAPVTLSYLTACGFLGLVGIGAGMFDVPLQSYLQHRSPAESRGSILAASNFLTFAGILVASGIFCLLRVPVGEEARPLFSSRQIFLLAGLTTIPVCVYIVWLIPQASIRFIFWLASRTIYRTRVVGAEHLPETGGALLVPNHIAYVDAMLLVLASSRPIRVVAWAGNFENWLAKSLGKLFGVILVNPNKPKSIVAALKEAREAVVAGELVCIFPEGGISRSGQLLAFRPGMMRILEGTGIPVIPVYIDELWGSIFSFSGGRFFWKMPQRIPYPLSIHFGKPMQAPQDVHAVRQAVQELGADAAGQRGHGPCPLVSDFIRMCKRRKWGWKVADSIGTRLTGGQLLMRSLILRSLLRKHVLGADEQYVGVLLPPSAGGFVVNMALALDRRISANLNYTNSTTTLNACIAHAGVKHVLTSRKFMEKMNFELDSNVVYLEDLAPKVSLVNKLMGVIGSYVVPGGWLASSLGVSQIPGDEIMTVIFTSGSTGVPKGVLLTHRNIATNVTAIDQIVRLNSSDVIVGILPFFHSFGYSITMWSVAGLDISGVYHFNPLDAKIVGKLCKENKGTVLLSTPTFLRGFIRRVESDEFATLDVVVTGAEKLPPDICDAFEAKFKVRPVEGYGTTELSPLVSVNVPPTRSSNINQVDRKEGTVGRPIPGVSAKITDLDTGAELPVETPGMLWIKGPNVMKGYLGREDLTREVIVDGWYKTGDVALIDRDGFIRITGRVSRFSKIAGEMVPHIQVEEEINRLLGAADDGEIKAAVTAVPDSKKGERLVVIHLPMLTTPQQIVQGLIDAKLPNLFVPSPDSFIETDKVPILGTGKLDLKAIHDLAEKRFCQPPANS